jgi:hypothetical protein
MAMVTGARAVVLAGLLAALLSSSCTDEAPAPVDARAVFVRASLDVRGARPTPEELREVLADPAALDDKIDALVDDPAFARRIADLWAPAFRTRIDHYPFDGEELGLDDASFQEAIAEEPLDLVSFIAMNDRPFTDLVTADFTLAREPLFSAWPLEGLEVGEGTWLPDDVVKARYTDGRPHAGVLTMNAFYWRHTSTLENANRGRTNAWSQALLCEDYLAQPIDFPRDIDLTDTESIHDAIRTNQACLACHHTLDPFASTQWGFMFASEDPFVWARYQPERERDWRTTTGRAPGYYGEPVEDLVGLGHKIAGDDRFVRCAVKRVVEGLFGRKLGPDDDGVVATHREAFLASGLSLKALVRSVLKDPLYRGQAATPPFGGSPAPVALKLVSPEVLDDELFALTGYRLRVEDRDALAVDFGLRTLAGGSDRGSAVSPSPGIVLAQRRLAEAGARALVDGVAEGGALAPVLEAADLSRAPDAEVLAELARVVLSHDVDASSDEVKALAALWADVEQVSDAREAWTAVLVALLADPELLLL